MDVSEYWYISDKADVKNQGRKGWIDTYENILNHLNSLVLKCYEKNQRENDKKSLFKNFIPIIKAFTKNFFQQNIIHQKKIYQ